MPHYLDFHNFAVNFETERVSPPLSLFFKISVVIQCHLILKQLLVLWVFLLFLSFLFHSVLFWIFTASQVYFLEFVAFHNWKMDICLTPLGLSSSNLDSEDRSDSRVLLWLHPTFIIYCCHCFLVINIYLFP